MTERPIAALGRVRWIGGPPDGGKSTGRLTWRPRTTSCWCRKAFSATIAAFVRVRSPTVVLAPSPSGTPSDGEGAKTTARFVIETAR
jgi:hypothetical protein